MALIQGMENVNKTGSRFDRLLNGGFLEGLTSALGEGRFDTGNGSTAKSRSRAKSRSAGCRRCSPKYPCQARRSLMAVNSEVGLTAISTGFAWVVYRSR